MTAPALLAVSEVTVRLGGANIVDAVSVEAVAGKITGLIGPNGAGKTTLFETISGFTPPTSGRIWFDGTDITSLPTHTRARRGLARGFQDAALFPAMTVTQAVQVALERHVARATDAIGELLALRSARRAEAWSRRQADDAVTEYGLGAYRDTLVAALSTGTRRIVELACLLVMRPRLLLLDEPTAGVAHAETDALADLIRAVRDDGIAVLLIEHDIPMIMSLCDHVYVLEAGRQIADGAPSRVAADPAVVASYLGSDFAGHDTESAPSTAATSTPAAPAQRRRRGTRPW